MINACKKRRNLILFFRMKKTFAALGIGASVLAALSSCRSTDDGFSYSSQYTVEDGEIPIWLIEGDEGVQVNAGSTTQNRNDTYIPDEVSDPLADISGTGASSQVQPTNIADVPPYDESLVMVQPLPPVTTPTPTTPVVKTPVVKTPDVKKPVNTTGKSTASTTNKNTGKGKLQGKQPRQTFTEPTLITYTVRKGDNLYDIAKRSRTTVAQIKKDSKLKGDTIYPGQVIKVRYIPKDYKPGKSDATGAANAKSRVHVVAKGETISGIAKKYGVPYTQVLKANNLSLSDAAKIRPGKRLTIPAVTKAKTR